MISTEEGMKDKVNSLSDRITHKERDIGLYRQQAQGHNSKVDQELRVALESIARAKDENLSPHKLEFAEVALEDAGRHLQAARDSWGSL
ncbi:MAG: hypothetical protein ABSB15_23675 [Bryobacteraceae bacterium]|jgi:hypothetical protein